MDSIRKTIVTHQGGCVLYNILFVISLFLITHLCNIKFKTEPIYDEVFVCVIRELPNSGIREIFKPDIVKKKGLLDTL